ncbi:MAG: phosphatase PAP2 family protein [Deltaproteobacteria bacterium]|nr:phosphatase PAP2 family protein [Deltaproteobacteria bacterium]
MKMKPLFAMVAVLLAQTSAQAAWNIDKSGLRVPAPPAPGSAADRKDFEILFQYQEKRTDEECRAADLQTAPTLVALFGPQTGVLTEGEIATVEDFGGEVVQTVEKAVKPFKRRFARHRPYDENSDLSPCVHKPGGQTSYPSSHAAIGVVLGDLLAEIFPAKAEQIRNEAQRVGENRVLGGVHHPTDIVAGRKLGAQIESALEKNADFMSAFNSLKH